MGVLIKIIIANYYKCEILILTTKFAPNNCSPLQKSDVRVKKDGVKIRDRSKRIIMR